jgi:hypothetical protein
VTAEPGQRPVLRHRVRPGPLPRPGWKALAFIAVTFAAALLFSLTCQRSQVRITQQQAIGIALKQVSFEPKRTQIRFVRQGLGTVSYWAVSLSVPSQDGKVYRRLAVVQVNANTGEVKRVVRERDVAVEGLDASPQESGPQVGEPSTDGQPGS